MLQIVQAGGGVSKLQARPRTPVFIEAQKHVRIRLERKWLTEFMATPEYLSRNKGSLSNGHGIRMTRTNGDKDSSTYVSYNTMI